VEKEGPGLAQVTERSENNALETSESPPRRIVLLTGLMQKCLTAKKTDKKPRPKIADRF